MKYSDCFKHEKLKILILCLGHNDDKTITFISFQTKYNEKNLQVGFVPYSTEVLRSEDLSFIGQFSPNLESLKEQLSNYRKLCDKQGLSDTFVTVSLSKIHDMVLGIIKSSGERFLSDFGYHLPLITPFGDWNSGKEVNIKYGTV